MLRTFLTAAAMVLAIPAAAQDADPSPAVEPGEFRDRSSFEMFHGMRINADGTYEWAISVGAMDRRSAGTWESQNGHIVLTTTPTPVAPEFVREDDDTSDDAPFLMVHWSNGRSAQGIEFVLICGDGKQISHYTQSDGWDLVPGECDDPQSISLEESIQDIGPAYFNLDEYDGTSGLRFTLVPNDFGVMDFTGAQVWPTETGIQMWLLDNSVEMERVENE